eukprot:g8175.t1
MLFCHESILTTVDFLLDSTGVPLDSTLNWIQSIGSNGRPVNSDLFLNSTNIQVGGQTNAIPQFQDSVFAPSSPPVFSLAQLMNSTPSPGGGVITLTFPNTTQFTQTNGVPSLQSTEAKFTSFEDGFGLESLLTLNDNEVSPELEESVLELYPFPEFQPKLDDPITTVAVVQAIVQANPQFLAQVIETRDDDAAVADGMKVPAEARDLWNAQTPDRNDDGDVVAIKGLAQAGLDGRSAKSLSNIFILSLTDFNHTVINPFIKEVPVVRQYLEGVFNDTSFLEEIISIDANTESSVYFTFGRKLLAANSSPVRSYTCAYCFPKQTCKVCHWCRKDKKRPWKLAH